jgi:hypothetical protein
MVKKNLQRHNFLKEIILLHGINDLRFYECYRGVNEIRNIRLSLKNFSIDSMVFCDFLKRDIEKTVRFTTTLMTHVMEVDEYMCRLKVTSNEDIYGYEGHIMYKKGEELPFRSMGMLDLLEVDLSHPAHTNNTRDGYHGVPQTYQPNLVVSLKN